MLIAFGSADNLCQLILLKFFSNICIALELQDNKYQFRVSDEAECEIFSPKI